MSLKNIYAPVPLTTRGQPTHISLHPDGTKLAYACGRTVVIRSISNPLAADVYSEHAKNVTAVKISPRCCCCYSCALFPLNDPPPSPSPLPTAATTALQATRLASCASGTSRRSDARRVHHILLTHCAAHPHPQVRAACAFRRVAPPRLPKKHNQLPVHHYRQ